MVYLVLRAVRTEPSQSLLRFLGKMSCIHDRDLHSGGLIQVRKLVFSNVGFAAIFIL
jgi:hypothetical protein